MPQCADGDKSFTVTFDRLFADWSMLFGPGTILPATSSRSVPASPI